MSDLSWMDDAACLNIDGFTELDPADAIPTCHRCPVIDLCAAYGEQTRALDVVYGGRLFVKGHRRTFTADAQADARRMAGRGVPIVIIARTLGFHVRTIERYLRPPTGGGGLTRQQRQAMRAAHARTRSAA